MADFFHMKLNGESFDALAAAAPHLIHAHIAEPGRGRAQTTFEDHAEPASRRHYVRLWLRTD